MLTLRPFQCPAGPTPLLDYTRRHHGSPRLVLKGVERGDRGDLPILARAQDGWVHPPALRGKTSLVHERVRTITPSHFNFPALLTLVSNNSQLRVCRVRRAVLECAEPRKQVRYGSREHVSELQSYRVQYYLLIKT